MRITIERSFDMPTMTYEALLAETLPARIATDDEYDRLYGRFLELFRKERRNRAEEQLFGLLGVLIEDYDHRTSLPPDESTPAEKLQFLLEHSGKKTADLAAIFGQRSHVNEALNGKRPISAEQARKLGRLFHLNPGLFL